MQAPGLGQSQRAILDALKRRGEATIPELAAGLALSAESVREHVRVLAGHELVLRAGTRRRTQGRGRPEILYRLAPAAEAMFPRREGELLHALAAHLVAEGHEDVLRRFLEHSVAGRRADALRRVEGLRGRQRLDEVARILSEAGFMAQVDDTPDGPALRLCHCPIRDLVAATRLPCRSELRFIGTLLGEPLARSSYIPAGDAACGYRVGEPKERRVR